MSYRAGVPGHRTVGKNFGDGARAYATAGMGSFATPAQMKKYWDSMAQACTQMADEGACLSRVARHVPVTIEPGFAGLGEGLGTAIGLDAHATARGDMVSVGGHWAQRAVNAYNAFNGSTSRIHVGGGVGPATMAGLRAAAHILPPTARPDDLRISHDPSTSTARVTTKALISQALYQALGRLTRVADPPRPPRSTHRTTSTAAITSASVSPTTTPTPSSGKVPGDPTAPPTDTTATVGLLSNGQSVIVDEGDTDWTTPALIIGAVVVAGGVGFVVWNQRRMAAPKANRRRKHKRRK